MYLHGISCTHVDVGSVDVVALVVAVAVGLEHHSVVVV